MEEAIVKFVGRSMLVLILGAVVYVVLVAKGIIPPIAGFNLPIP